MRCARQERTPGHAVQFMNFTCARPHVQRQHILVAHTSAYDAAPRRCCNRWKRLRLLNVSSHGRLPLAKAELVSSDFNTSTTYYCIQLFLPLFVDVCLAFAEQSPSEVGCISPEQPLQLELFGRLSPLKIGNAHVPVKKTCNTWVRSPGALLTLCALCCR